MKSDFSESNLENTGSVGTQLGPGRALPSPTGWKCSSCVVPQLSPEQLSHQKPQPGTKTPSQQPWGSLVIPGTAVTRDSNSDDTCTFPEKKKLGPSTLKYITLAGSAISTVFATSPKCIFKDSFKNCFDVDLYNSDAIQQLSDDDQPALCFMWNQKPQNNYKASRTYGRWN